MDETLQPQYSHSHRTRRRPFLALSLAIASATGLAACATVSQPQDGAQGGPTRPVAAIGATQTSSAASPCSAPPE